MEWLQFYAPAMVVGGLDPIESVIQAIDGEKHPLCLLVAFQCVCQVTSLYPPLGELTPRVSPERLQEPLPPARD